MKKIIVQEVSSFILRPSALPSSVPSTSAATPKDDRHAHAKYYAVITFNQILLSPKDKDVAERLIDVYFELFREILGEKPSGEKEEKPGERDFTPKQRRGYKGKKDDKKKDRKGKGKAQDDAFQEVPDENAKLVSAILTGINRALPYAKLENSAYVSFTFHCVSMCLTVLLQNLRQAHRHPLPHHPHIHPLPRRIVERPRRPPRRPPRPRRPPAPTWCSSTSTAPT
jgi:hypothetical protein